MTLPFLWTNPLGCRLQGLFRPRQNLPEAPLLVGGVNVLDKDALAELGLESRPLSLEIFVITPNDKAGCPWVGIDTAFRTTLPW